MALRPHFIEYSHIAPQIRLHQVLQQIDAVKIDVRRDLMGSQIPGSRSEANANVPADLAYPYSSPLDVYGVSQNRAWTRSSWSIVPSAQRHLPRRPDT